MGLRPKMRHNSPVAYISRLTAKFVRLQSGVLGSGEGYCELNVRGCWLMLNRIDGMKGTLVRNHTRCTNVRDNPD